MYDYEKKQLFNGYVKEPLPMVILASIVGVALLLFALWGTYEVLTDTNQTTPTTIITSIIKYHKEGPLIVFTASNNQRFNLPKRAVNEELLTSLISNEKSLRLTYDIETIDREIGADILAIDNMENHKIVSYEEVQQADKMQGFLNCIFLWVCFILYFIFISICYYVISHAETFPQFAALLVRRDFRNF